MNINFLNLVISVILIISATHLTAATDIPILHHLELSLDGELNEDFWRKGLIIKGFREMLSDSPASANYETTFYLLTDGKYLYWGGICEQPVAEISAASVREEAIGFGDDLVTLEVDPFNEGLGLIKLSINPRGLHSSHSSWDRNWRPKWSSAARVKENGWSFEAKIPLRVLKLQRGKRTIRLRASRYIYVKGIRLVWPHRASFLSLEEMPRYGITVIGDTSSLKLAPQLYSIYLGASEGGPKVINGTGLDISYRASTYKLSATINPSFLDKEVRQRQLLPSANSISYSETRPFFREDINYISPRGGMGISYMGLSTGYSLFYTYSIRDVSFGLKLTGKFGDISGGLMYLSTPNESLAVMKLSRSNGKWKYSLFLAPDVYSVDVARTDKYNLLSFELAMNGRRSAGSVSYYRDTYRELRRSSLTLNFEWIDDGFTAKYGFVPLTGVTTYTASADWTYYAESGNRRRYSTLYIGLSGMNFYGTSETVEPFKYQKFSVGCSWRREQWYLNLSLSYNSFDYLTEEDSSSLRGSFRVSYIHPKGDYTYSVYYNLLSFLGEPLHSYGVYAYQGITDNLSLTLFHRVVDMRGYHASDTSVSLDLESEHWITSLGLAIDERGRSNLYIRFSKIVAERDELYLMIGSPNANRTRELVFLKYMRYVDFEL